MSATSRRRAGARRPRPAGSRTPSRRGGPPAGQRRAAGRPPAARAAPRSPCTNPAATSARVPEVGVPPRLLRRRARSTSPARSVASNRGLLQHLVDDRARPASRRAWQPVRARPARGAAARAADGGTGAQSVRRLVGGARVLGLAPDGRCFVDVAGDARVRHASPGRVEGAVEDCAPRASAASPSACSPPRSRVRADPLDATRTARAQANAASTSASDRFFLPYGATSPSAARSNSKRDSGESPVSRSPAHHSTAWCCARVTRHVEEAQRLALALHLLELAVRLQLLSGPAHVDRPLLLVGRVVEDGHADLVDVAVPGVGAAARSGTPGPCCGGS